MLSILFIIVTGAVAQTADLDKIVLSGGGSDYDIMRSINADVGKACAFTDKEGSKAFAVADANNNSKLDPKEFGTMSAELNKSLNRGCKTIKLVTDG